MAKNKKADRVRQIFNTANGDTRTRWEYINQRAYDFANDNQLTNAERVALEEQGMPTFTINRISPVVEMLNFYATANNPRWQAIGVEGSDTDVAGVISDLADYIWANSNGSSLYSNAINDSITKSVGYLQVDLDRNQDNGMGEVIIKQPAPFDVFPDPKSRDMLFRDASFVLVRKILPKTHLLELFPEYKTKINKSSSDESTDYSYTDKNRGVDQVDFTYKDINTESVDPKDGSHDSLIELFELFEKIRIEYVNIFYRVPINKEQLEAIKQQVQVRLQETAAEQAVQLKEQAQKMAQAVKGGGMLQERMALELKKLKKQHEATLQQIQIEYQSQLQREAEKISSVIISKKERDVLMEDKEFAGNVVNEVSFFQSRIKQTCVAGDTLLYETVLPE